MPLIINGVKLQTHHTVNLCDESQILISTNMNRKNERMLTLCMIPKWLPALLLTSIWESSRDLFD